VRDFERVRDVRLATDTALTGVGVRAEPIGRAYVADILFVEIRL